MSIVQTTKNLEEGITPLERRFFVKSRDIFHFSVIDMRVSFLVRGRARNSHRQITIVRKHVTTLVDLVRVMHAERLQSYRLLGLSFGFVTLFIGLKVRSWVGHCILL